MSETMRDAIINGDLERVKRLVAEGADVAEAHVNGDTALLWAAYRGRIPIMHWLLNEGGSNLAEKDSAGHSALSLAALNGSFPAMQYLLEERKALMSETNMYGDTVWDSMHKRIYTRKININSAELSSLLKVMVLLDDAPANFIRKLSPPHTDICTQGRQLRAQLPLYLKQQRAAVVAHCPLPTVLQSLVASYAATTPEDMWTDGLRVQAPRSKRARVRQVEEAEDEDAPPYRRSLRLRQNRA
jgi:hypothetical protein